MIITIDTPELYNEICESIRSFLDEPDIAMGENGSLTVSVKENNGFFAHAEYAGTAGDASSTYTEGDIQRRRALKFAVKTAVFRALKAATGQEQPWGSLTGIRPTKLLYEGITARELTENYQVSQSKAELLQQIISRQRPYINVPAGSADVYIGIPFCRTRCIYCSFATNDATKLKLIPQYSEVLFDEIKQTAEMISNAGINIRCMYIGGGTPTALDEDNFSRLMEQCRLITPSLEFTVEAGRPDTITPAKLTAMKNAGVTRISINPQSMNDSTLQLIGRHHTSAQIEECFALAKSYGFKSINADLIAGLPGEDEASFAESLRRIIDLSPENITVHTLSLKRGSYMTEHPEKFPLPDRKTVERQVDGARELLTNAGWLPYYLYRQKYQAGNLENVGYAKQGTECIYNIDIMEETTDIMALGAGGISKRLFAGGRIERSADPKGIFDYISRNDNAKGKRKLFLD